MESLKDMMFRCMEWLCMGQSWGETFFVRSVNTALMTCLAYD